MAIATYSAAKFQPNYSATQYISCDDSRASTPTSASTSRCISGRYRVPRPDRRPVNTPPDKMSAAQLGTRRCMRFDVSQFPSTSRLCACLSPEHLCGTPSGTDRGSPSGEEVRLHRTPEGVALQRPTRDGLVREPKFTKRELVAEQPIGIRLVGVVRAHMIDRQRDDVDMVVGQAPWRVDRHKSGRVGEPRRQLFRPHHLDVGNG